MGDYLGITSKGGKVYPCWTDNRGGLYMTYVSPFELGLNAGFTAPVSTICSGASVTFTDVSTGPPTSWTWSFPGGSPSSWIGPTPPAITYNSPGTYDVSLTVSDGVETDTETKTGFITVKNVIAEFTGTPSTVVIGNSVTFTDNSSCSPATWSWSFPGGTPSSWTGPTPPPITYSTTGTYDVSLTVTKPSGADTKTKTGYITVTLPIFNMTNGTITTCTGDFYDSGGSTGAYQNNESYTMTFYPATPGSLIRFNFTSFSTESGYDYLRIYDGINTSAPLIGSYNGTAGPGIVTASNAAGALTFNFTSDVSVTSTGWAATVSCYSTTVPPVADFSAAPVNTMIAETVTFTDLSQNLPTSWAWSISPATYMYAGGTNSTSQNPQVQFSALGSYSVTLTATNAYGSDTEVKSNYIHVTNCTVATFPFTESFENQGAIPNCWTQEQVNNSGVNWVFITGNGTGYPATAHTGTYNACLKDGNSADNKTRLITPKLDLSNLPNPQLKFWHTQALWSPDQDQLSVFYKTSAGGAWTLLTTYTASITAWTERTIPLPAASGEYYIAFEGNAKWGRGVCIDDVEISSSCAVIYPVSITIAASANPVDEGTSVTFTATGINGGANPLYQWKVNGANTGINSDTHSYVPDNGDVVTCTLSSSLDCAGGNPATSNSITMIVQSVPVIRNINDITVGGSQCYDAQQTIMVAGGGSYFTVQPGGSAMMIAGQNIVYFPGTVITQGGYMYGYIAPGGPWCGVPAKPVIAAGNEEKFVKPERTFFRVFPNPTTGAFTLALNGYIPAEQVGVTIYNMKGEKVLSDFIVNELRHEFSLSGVPSGLYLVKVETGSRTGTARILKVD
jgi:PKD repeat protein